MHLELKVFGPCLALGISTFVMLSTESLLSISFTSSLSRFGGDVAVGAMTIITSISQLVSLPLQGICQGGQPIISYNFGANKPNRCKKSIFYTVLYLHHLHICLLSCCDDFSKGICSNLYFR